MPTRPPARVHQVQKGEDLLTIGAEYGFKPETLWALPENAALRERRGGPDILMEGDEVHIPEMMWSEYEITAGETNVFQRAAAVVSLRLELLDEDGEFHADTPFLIRLRMKTDEIAQDIEGTTDGDGVLDVSIPIAAIGGEILLNPETEDEYVIEFELGSVDSAHEGHRGLQTMLNNLGYECGREDDALGQFTLAAIRQFQRDHGLEILPEDSTRIDRATREAIENAFSGLMDVPIEEEDGE